MMGLLGGVLPSGYTQVEYIETTSAKHDFTPYAALTPNLVCEFKLQFCEIGAVSGFRRLIYEYNATYGMGAWWAWYGQGGLEPGYTDSRATEPHIWTIANKEGSIDGNAITLHIGTQADNESLIFCFGARQTYNTQNKTQRLYYINFKNSVGLVCKLIPCYRNSDGHIGMYDVTNYTFEDFGTTTDGWSVPSNN